MSTKQQYACVKSKPIIAIGAPVSVEAAAKDTEGKLLPPKFTATFYTGVAMDINGWDLPVVIDLAGLQEGNSLVANLDHDRSKRVGNFALANDGKSLVANGTASARTAARDEVIGSAEDGFNWQASIEVTPIEVEAVKKGHTAEANGRTFDGPMYITRKGVLKGFAFVSHGADDNTSATIAASAASTKEQKMLKPEVKAWAAEMLPSLDLENISDQEAANLEANYNGLNGKKAQAIKASTPFEAAKLEAKRREELRDIADKLIERRGLSVTQDEIIAIEKMYDHAIEAAMSPTEFRCELYEATVPMGHTVRATNRDKHSQLTNKVLEAAICQAGHLPEKDRNGKPHFDDQTMQLAHDRFKGNISLCQFLLLAAEANGHNNGYSRDVNRDVLRAAFANKYGGQIRGAGGYSTIDVDSITGNTANKFILVGWMTVDQAMLKLAAIRNVRDFKTVTTVSLTGDAQYSKLGAAGEIKHATLGEQTYTYNADTYAAMLAITRTDIINDDLGALTDVPRRLGRGAMLKLNDIFWTAFLGAEGSGFYAAGHNNLNTAAADVTVAGLDATFTLFKNQLDPNSKPLAIEPKIWAVPTAQYGAALRLMNSELLIDGTSTGLGGNANIWRGRFEVVTSPYMSNSSYTGYSTSANYLMADPNDLPAFVIPALNGRIEPTVETADADFNTLGIQMRGYSDVGVAEFEYRAAVKADGGSS